MRLRPFALPLVLAIAGCGPTIPPTALATASVTAPSASGSVQGATATPAPSRVTLPTDAIVAWIVDDGRPFFDLVVEAIAPTGAARPLATQRDIHPAGWSDASPRLDAPVRVSAAGWVVISVERNGGGAPDLERTLILRLDASRSEGSGIELPNVSERVAWGPRGELAIFAPRPVLVDPATGTADPITVPASVDLLEAWAADGSGWLAIEHIGAVDTRPGVLRRDGTFVADIQPAYAPTGRERVTGTRGEALSEAVSDGPEGSETAIVDFGPGVCPRCIIWAKFATAGDAPHFNDYVWDAAGQGLWITWQSADRKRAWLGHMTSPGLDQPVVDLAPGIDFEIVGISPSDAWLVLEAGEQRTLLIADTLTPATRVLARPLVPDGPTPNFAGWSNAAHG